MRRSFSKLDPAIVAIVRAGLEAGLASDEIAEMHGIAPRRVRRYFEALGMAGLKPYQRQFTFRCTARTARLIRQLAAEVGESPGKKIDQMVSIILADGLPMARRRLGKLHKATGSANVKS